MRDSTDGRMHEFDDEADVERVIAQEVVQGPVLVVVSDKEELCPGTGSFDVSRNESWIQD